MFSKQRLGVWPMFLTNLRPIPPRCARRQCGLGLSELMIAIAIGSFIALAGTTFYVTSVGASKEIYDSAVRTEQVFAPIDSLVQDLRRSGYRGLPTALTNYLVTTRGSGGAIAGDEGDFPAVEFGTSGAPSTVGASADCVLVAYVRDYTCVAGDDSNFTACTTAGDVVPLHHRFGYRLQSNALEATVVVHPDEFLSSAPTDSACDASGSDSAWIAITQVEDVFIDSFSVELIDEDIADGDNGCVLGISAASPCDGYGSTEAKDCGTTALSCRIDRLYKITLCAYPGNTDNQCGSDPDGKLSVELFAKPRNSVLIQKAT